jgi:hypothetical protein
MAMTPLTGGGGEFNSQQFAVDSARRSEENMMLQDALGRQSENKTLFNSAVQQRKDDAKAVADMARSPAKDWAESAKVFVQGG